MAYYGNNRANRAEVAAFVDFNGGVLAAEYTEGAKKRTWPHLIEAIEKCKETCASW